MLIRSFIRYKNFLIYGTPSFLLTLSGHYLVPIFIFMYFGSAVAGHFSLAQQILMIPSLFVGQAIAQVFLQRASVAIVEKRLDVVVLQFFDALVDLGFFPICMISFSAKEVFCFVFGAEWINAGVYAQCLLPLVVTSFIFIPLNGLYSLLEEQKRYFYFEILYVSLCVAGFALGLKFPNEIISFSLFSLGAAASNIIKLFYLLNKSIKDKTKIKKMLFLNLRIPMSYIFIFLFCSLLKNVCINYIATLIFLIIYLRYLYAKYKERIGVSFT